MWKALELFPAVNDFITAVDEKSIIIVKGHREGEGYPEMNEACTCNRLIHGLNQTEGTHIAYGTIVNELKEVSRSYKKTYGTRCR